MLKRNLFTAFAVAGLGMGLAAAPAQASEELSSSMLATCVGAGGSCDELEFTLNVTGSASTYYMQNIALWGSSGLWSFNDVLGVWSDGSPVVWTGNMQNNGALNLVISNNAPFDPAPITIRVQMNQFGNASQLAGMYYTANGYTTETGPDGFFSTEGTVTPEPVTTLLLGTGLAGLVGVGRRRKTLLAEEEDAV